MSRNFLTYNSVVYCGEDLQSCWVGAVERTECCCGGNINALNVQIREVCIWLLSFMHFEWFKSLIESRDYSIYTAKSHSLYSSSISISLSIVKIYIGSGFQVQNWFVKVLEVIVSWHFTGLFLPTIVTTFLKLPSACIKANFYASRTSAKKFHWLSLENEGCCKKREWGLSTVCRTNFQDNSSSSLDPLFWKHREKKSSKDYVM